MVSRLGLPFSSEAEQCAINVCFLIKLDKVLAQYLSTKMLTDLIIKAFIVTILESALHAMVSPSCVKTSSLR